MHEHVVLYVPGLGDRDLSIRKRMFKLWKFKRVSIDMSPMHWTHDESFDYKLSRLKHDVHKHVNKGKKVTLIGESAGASAVMAAYEQLGDALHAVILLCGKSQYPSRVSPYLYKRNPALKDAVTTSDRFISRLNATQKSKILNVHPVVDPVVPVSETKIDGVKNVRMPIAGHAPGIVFGMTVFNRKLVSFIKSKE